MNPIARKIVTALIVAAPIAGGIGFKASQDGRMTTRYDSYSLLNDSAAQKFGPKKVYIVKEGSFTNNLLNIFKNRTSASFCWRSADIQKYITDPEYRIKRNQMILDAKPATGELMKLDLRLDYKELQKIKAAAQDSVKLIKKIH